MKLKLHSWSGFGWDVHIQRFYDRPLMIIFLNLRFGFMSLRFQQAAGPEHFEEIPLDHISSPDRANKLTTSSDRW